MFYVLYCLSYHGIHLWKPVFLVRHWKTHLGALVTFHCCCCSPTPSTPNSQTAGQEEGRTFYFFPFYYIMLSPILSSKTEKLPVFKCPSLTFKT